MADLTGVRVQDVFLPQVRFALNSILEEEPSEEPDLWWSMVLPDKAVVVAGGAGGNGVVVDHGSDELTVHRLQPALPFIRTREWRPRAQDVADRAEFSLHLPCKPRDEEVFKAPARCGLDAGAMVRNMAVQSRECRAKRLVPNPTIFPEGCGCAVLHRDAGQLAVSRQEGAQRVPVSAFDIPAQSVHINVLACPSRLGGSSGVMKAV